MGKGSHMSYECDNVLGKLYRIVSLYPVLSLLFSSLLNFPAMRQIDQDPRFNPASEDDITNGIDARLSRLVIPPFFLNLAAELKEQYDLELWNVLLR
jgi:hypothetical protein